VGDRGELLDQAEVVEFDASRGRFQLATSLVNLPIAGRTYELVSTDEAPVLAIRYLLGLRREQPIPPVVLRLGTTRGTNALITRAGARTALITTRGFGDLWHIGYQSRPQLFALDIRKPTPLFARVVEVDERLAHAGEVLRPLEEAALEEELARLKSANIESLAICLLHACANPLHEQRIVAIARSLGFREISASHEVAPIAKIVPRGDTTVLDAYLNPVLRTYVEILGRSLTGSDVRAMTSSGVLTPAARFRGKDSILSGPAGGAMGAVRAAEAAGYRRAIGFDMGGTSTDVSLYDGRPELQFETEKAGVRVVAPMLAIETVAAGGGSICGFDGVKLVVGPASAGADPGPACYGRGGPLTVTDVNLYLGRIVADHFPLPLDRAAVDRGLAELADEISQATGQKMRPLQLASGYVRVANANMARALRSISVAKGYDPREYLLVPFGGAAGQHACELAQELGISEILFHPDAGLLSAWGVGLAEHARHRATSVYRRLEQLTSGKISQILMDLERQARTDLQSDLPHESNVVEQMRIHRSLDLRYFGVEATLTIGEASDGDYAAEFEREHRRLYGYVQHDRPIEIVAARVEAVFSTSKTPIRSHFVEGRPAVRLRQQPACFEGDSCDAAVFDMDELSPGDIIAGPAIVVQPHSTIVLPPGWIASMLSGRELRATSPKNSNQELNSPAADADVADPVRLEVFNNHFASIAEQMGIALRNTAVSVNVKERLDYSCAVFNRRGDLVANAPHVPVHLGAMGETVRRMIADNPAMVTGDVFVSNDPYRGGSHIPDVTVITPVFAAPAVDLARVARSDPPAESDPLFFTASRAHHAEIGGIAPGSMPPFSKNLSEEGVLIQNLKLIDAGHERFDRLEALLRSGPYPSRAVGDNLSDIAAQVAANQRGAAQLLALVDRYGVATVEAFMRHVQRAAADKTQTALRRFASGRYTFVDHLDDGSPIRVVITIADGRTLVDFTGTGPVLATNLNANPAITKAAVMYVLRSLIDEDIPLNDGVIDAVEIVLPEGLLNPPAFDDATRCAAIAAGNVETSQRVVDVLLGALGVAAASQGTMNNVLFGNEQFGYYETIAGGSGATANADGADAVHTHMTNTRMTDPEVLERRFPVRLLEFGIRHGSGGAGRHRGGDGIVRRIQFLAPLAVSIVSQRRGPYPPYGLKGGAPGALGKNTLLRDNGKAEQLGSCAQVFVQPGDTLVIETPGGGGWGKPNDGYCREPEGTGEA
jgi:5-oxoprolinase (ATP-hydrolysing)